MKPVLRQFITIGFIALALCLSKSSFAGDRGGNGGDGIEIDGKLYVLDLVEAGIEQDPYVDETLVVNEFLRENLEKNLSPEHFPIDLIGQKLIEISKIDPVLSRLIIQTILHYRWTLVNGALINISDENSLLDYAGLRQLAVRRDTNIMIDKKAWLLLDKKNQTALVFHEMLYALVKPNIEGTVTTQDSVIARNLTGLIFTPGFADMELFKLERIKLGHYPAFLNSMYKIPWARLVEHGGLVPTFKIFYNPRIVININDKQKSVYNLYRENESKTDEQKAQEIGQLGCEIWNKKRFSKGSIQLNDMADRMFVHMQKSNNLSYADPYKQTDVEGDMGVNVLFSATSPDSFESCVQAITNDAKVMIRKINELKDF